MVLRLSRVAEVAREHGWHPPKFAITRKNDAFDAEIVNTHLTKVFLAIFAPDERLPRSATLIVEYLLISLLLLFN